MYENWPVLNGTLSEVYRYDISGNLIGYTDPKNNLNEDGVTTTYQYDALNRITTVKDAMNQITNINYTVLGQISSVAIKQNAASAASENLYTKTYDELGNILGKADSTSLVTDYSYNTIGLNTKVIDRNGSTLNIAYDELARVKETNQFSSDNTKSIRHLYNNNSPFGYTSDSMYTNGTLTTSNTFTYNVNGQVIKKDTTGSGYILSNLKLNYDNAGRLNSVGAGVAGNNYFYANYKYTGDRLNQVQSNGLQANSTADTDNVIYKYFPDGKLEKITYPKLNDGSYLTTEYTYNPIGRMTSMVNKKGTTILSQFIYTYDSNGNILSVNDGLTTKTYVYDKLNRLIEIQPQAGNKTVYSYNLRGNRLTQSGDNINLDLVNTSYSYDLENKLKTVTKGGMTTTMQYYADGYRAKKESSTGYTNYIYNLSGKLIAEAQNASTVTANYVWGPDRALVKKVVGGSDYYYLYNGHGDVVQMVDRNGNVVNNYQYDEWGNILVSNETVSNPFKYAGEVYDQETGLYYLRARYYDPTVGRFINEDSVEGQIDNPLSFNLYIYCINNPLIYNDPSGHIPVIIPVPEEANYGYPFIYSGKIKSDSNASGNNYMKSVKKLGDAIEDYYKMLSFAIVMTFSAPTKLIVNKVLREGKSDLPNQGTVQGNVDGAPPVDAGKQGKHVPGHQNDIPGKSQWKPGENGVDETQEAWQKGTELPDGTKVWDTGKVVGQNGETGVRVHIDGKGNIHGYPVKPGQYLK